MRMPLPATATLLLAVAATLLITLTGCAGRPPAVVDAPGAALLDQRIDAGMPRVARAAIAACAPLEGAATARSSDLLRAHEMRRRESADLLTTLRHQRPEWLRMQRMASRAPSVLVYFDGVPIGGIDMLGTVRASDVQVARLVRPTDATQRYGRQALGGVVELYSHCLD